MHHLQIKQCIALIKFNGFRKLSHADQKYTCIFIVNYHVRCQPYKSRYAGIDFEFVYGSVRVAIPFNIL